MSGSNSDSPIPCTADEASAAVSLIPSADPFAIIYEPEPGEMHGALRVAPALRAAVLAALADVRAL
jgi:hypothetical protein